MPVGTFASAVHIATTCVDVLSEPFDTLSAWAPIGSPTIVAGGRNGTGLEIDSSSETADYDFSANSSDTVTVGFAFKVSRIDTQPEVVGFANYTDGIVHNTVRVQTTGALLGLRGAASIGSASAAGLIVPNIWYYLEVQITLHDTAGSLKIRLNGTEVVNVANADTRNGGSSPGYQGVKLRTGALSTSVQWDDLYISTGAACTFKGDPLPASPVLVNNDPCDNFTFAPWANTGSSVVAGGFVGNGISVPTGGGAFINFNIPASLQSAAVTVGCRIKFSTMSGSANPFIDWRSDSGATSHVQLKLYTAGTLGFYRTSPLSALGTPVAHGMVTGTWYYIEASMRLSDTAGQCIVRKDGVEQYRTVATEDTKSAGTKTVLDQLRFTGSSGTAFIVDDVYIRNDLKFGVS